MLTEPPSPHDSGPQPPFLTGQTLFFIGDHTSPDDPGYVAIVSTVLARFHPGLGLNLISAGSPGQSAAGLRSSAMIEILTSSRPDWLVVGLGLADAAREPAAIKLMREHRERAASEDEALAATFGPEYRSSFYDHEPPSDSGSQKREIELVRLPAFQQHLREAISELSAAGVRPILLTTTFVDNDPGNPVNHVLGAYNRAIRKVSDELGVPLVDVERAFKGVFDRAANYKQKAMLFGPDGKLLAQGQSLLARTFLGTFGLLPGAGSRP
jgi:lysophospholipase L1-like esterase